MKKVENESYNRVIAFLHENCWISSEDRRYLNHYATQLYKHNIENSEFETLDDIFESIREYSENLKNHVDTSITSKRILDLIDIVQTISSIDFDLEQLYDISYQLDKMFYETDLPLRKNSSLSYNLVKFKKKDEKRYESK